MKIEPSEVLEQTKISLKTLGENYKHWPLNPPITLHWENLNAYTPSPNAFINRFRKQKLYPKHIVKYINGVAKPGSFMAIMGASGAGKTTLLNMLTFRNRGNLKITGDVKINGSLITSVTELTSLSGYIQQQDMFLGYLKVIEQLQFQANLKMDKHTTNAEKAERVQETLNDLGLKKVENSYIGDPERGIKGISGGERRRLSFGCELITNPSLLFADEPTSGLDSYMAMSVIDCMRRLADRGKTVICTIHQPSSPIFQKFDRLCLLAEGSLAYMGDLSGANTFFTNQGYPCPQNYNPADHYINTLALVPYEKQEGQNTIKKLSDNFQVSMLNTKLNYELKGANDKLDDPYFQVTLSKKVSYKVNAFTQLKWLSWRSGLSTLRDPTETLINIFQTIIISVILGLIYLKLNYDQPGIQNINGVLFLLIANTSFTYIIAVINTFTLEIPLFLRENQSGVYMVITYYLSKIFIDIPKFIILPFLLTTIVYWMTNLNTDPSRYILCCIIIILVAHTSVAFGTFLSALSPNVNVALNLTGPLLPPLMIFSGFFLNNASTPPYFLWLKYLSWFNYSNELLNVNQWTGVKNITCNILEDLCLTEGEQVLNQFNYDAGNTAINYIAIVLLLIGFRSLTFIVLLIKSYRK